MVSSDEHIELELEELFLVASWPDGTFSVLFYPVEPYAVDVFMDLDEEANPFDAKLSRLVNTEGGVFCRYDLRCTKNKDRSFTLLSHDYEIVELKWPDNVYEEYYRYMSKESESLRDDYSYLVRSDGCSNDGDSSTNNIAKE